MQKYQAVVYDPSRKMRDHPLSSDDWNSFIFQLDGRIRKLDKEFRSSLKYSAIIPLVAVLSVVVALRLWPPGAVIVLLILPCYIALAPHRCNPIARARHAWQLKQLWVNERDRQTAPDAVSSLE
jgi:hypothetical protein